MKFAFVLKVDHLNRALAAVRRGIEQPQYLLSAIGFSLQNINDDRNKAEKAPDGSKWTPLSPRTLARKKSRSRILVNHGDMLGNGLVHEVQGNTLRVYAADRKGGFHQLGVRSHPQGRGHHPGMPARPIVGFPEADRQHTFEIVDEYLKTILDQKRGKS